MQSPIWFYKTFYLSLMCKHMWLITFRKSVLFCAVQTFWNKEVGLCAGD